MPSILAHIFLGLVVAYALGIKKKSLVLLGCMLPDAKIFLFALALPLLGPAQANALIIPIHTPAGSLLLGLFVSSLFAKNNFLRHYKLLGLGIFTHYILDAAMFPFNGIEHYLLLYPLTWDIYGIETGNLTYYFTLTGFVVLIFFIGVRELKRRNIKILLP
jgi:hypothetical protein